MPRSADPVHLLSRLVAPDTAPDTAPDAERANRRLNGPQVYGVYAVAPVAEPSDWPAGDYAVVFAAHTSAGISGTTVRIADGGIVSIEFGCGPTPPAQLAAAFANQLLAASPDGLNLAGTRTVTQVDRLPPFATQETEPRWQAAIELSDSVGGYSSVLIDAKTEIVGADGQLGNIDTIEPGQRVEIEGTPLPWSLWRAESA